MPGLRRPNLKGRIAAAAKIVQAGLERPEAFQDAGPFPRQADRRHVKLIDADHLGTLMAPAHLVEALRQGHRSGALGEVERLLLHRAAPPNAALTWAGWSPDLGIAVKTATVFPSNAQAGRKPNIQSVVVLFDPEDGSPLAAIHGESFTRMKTAANSALGVDLLANPMPGTLAILGAGGQAETQARFILAMRPSITRILIWNRTRGSADRLAARLGDTGAACRAVATPEDAATEADVITCVTATATPVLEGAWLRPGCHVDLVGAYTPEMRESDDAVVRRGRLFADTRRFGVMTCGDYAQPILAGVITEGDVLGDSFDLVSGRVPGRTGPSDITVFKNGGGGHLDLMAAAAFYAQSQATP